MFTEKDEAEIRSISRQYVEAWLAGDSEKVLSLYTDDAVLIPHHGETPVEGKENIRLFWFNPTYTPTKVEEMENNIAEVEGSKDLAFLRGRGRLIYVQQGVRYQNAGNFINILKRTPSGWKIYRHMWDDPAPEEQ
jgi:uncharacterized protein (TIGR02246 family)